MRPLAALSVIPLLVAVAGCGGEAGGSCGDVGMQSIGVTYGIHPESPSALVAASDVVVVGTVARCQGLGEQRGIVVDVEEVLAGEVPIEPVVVVDQSRIDADGRVLGAGTPMVVDGDRAVFSLICEEETCVPAGHPGIVQEDASGDGLIVEVGSQDALRESVDGSFDRLVDELRSAG